MENTYTNNSAWKAPAVDRAEFIRQTYLHLAGAILAFAFVETILLQLPLAPAMVEWLAQTQYSWLVVMGLFMIVSYVADAWSRSEVGAPMQYLGLGVYILAEAIVFLPLLYIATKFFSPDVLPIALTLTGFLFTGLSAVVLLTRQDFSWMRSILCVAGMVALGTIVASILFGFSLGIIFCSLMVLYCSGMILYNTSNVLHHYRTDQHVAASLSLFASIALLFWYILRIVMSLSSDD